MVSVRRIISLLPLIFITVVARELRPSEHGLDYETSAVGEELAPEMKEFFRSAPNSKSSMALPTAMNSNDTTWWNDVTGVKSGGGGDRLKHVLLVASLVSGAVGVALLVVSGVMYFRRYKTPNRIIDSSKAIVNITK